MSASSKIVGSYSYLRHCEVLAEATSRATICLTALEVASLGNGIAEARLAMTGELLPNNFADLLKVKRKSKKGE